MTLWMQGRHAALAAALAVIVVWQTGAQPAKLDGVLETADWDDDEKVEAPAPALESAEAPDSSVAVDDQYEVQTPAAALSDADSLLEKGLLDSAEGLYRGRLAVAPDPAALTGLGRIAFAQSRYEECIDLTGRGLAAGTPRTLSLAYCRGASFGRLGKYAEAVAELSQGESLPGDRALKDRMRGQLALYESRLFESVAREAVAAESASETGPLNDTLVAVVAFKNAAAGSRLDPLAKGLADMVITDLSQVSGLRVVERTQVQKLQQELALDMAGITTNENRVRVARLLKASRVVAGAYSAPDSTTIRIKGGFVETATGNAASAREVSGPLAKFFEVEKKFVFALVDRMGIKLTDEERVQIQKVPTEDLLAYLAYSQGLDARDKGDYKAAQAAFANAAQRDPKFTRARAMANVMKAAEAEQKVVQGLEEPAETEMPVVFQGSGPQAVEKEQEAVAQAEASAAPVTVGSVSVISQSRFTFSAGSDLGHHMSTMAGAGFMPEVAVDTRGGEERVAEQTSSSGEESGGATDDNVDVAPPAGEVNTARPDYADYRGLGFGEGMKLVPITVELPDAL